MNNFFYEINEQEYRREISELIGLNLPYEKLDRKCILITGGTGAVGRVMVDFLMELCKVMLLKIKVMVISRNGEKACEIFRRYCRCDNFKYISGDIAEDLQICEDIDFIIHAASNTHPVQYANDPIGTIMTSVNGTYHMLELAGKKNAEFILCSSVEIYGENVRKLYGFSEEDCGYINCASLRSGYPEGKRVAESLCHAFGAKKNVKFKIVRLARVYGATMQKNDSKAVSQFFRNAIQGKQIELKSNGEQLYSYIYVMDCVSGIFTVMLKGNNEEVYNISGTNSVITLKELAKLLGKVFQVGVVRTEASDEEKKGFSKATHAVLNSGKLQSLGWEERTSICKGIEKMQILMKRAGEE